VIERRYQLGKPVEPAFSPLFGETSDIADRDTFRVLFVSTKMNGKLFFWSGDTHQTKELNPFMAEPLSFSEHSS
jgi:hypothetical protein